MFNQILCVDDDPITLVILKMTMQKCQFTQSVLTAADGVEAVNLYETLQQRISLEPTLVAPEIIFLDLNMPVMGGWSFLEIFNERFQATFPNTKVIILSSSIDPEDIRKVQNFGIVKEFVSKPMTIDTLNRLKAEFEVS